MRSQIPPQVNPIRNLMLLLALFLASSTATAQTSAPPAKPYATLDRASVAYHGPVRSTPEEIATDTVVIGMILPLKGAQQSESEELLAAAQLAMEQEQANGPLPGGRRLQLAVRDETGPWGQVSTEILKLIDQDHAVAVLTSANATSAHLAEQIANKISIPVLTLSSDPSTTQANVPWLFRLGPNDTDQTHAFCQRIYSERGAKSVLLIAQMDHDGKTGAAEFEKQARALNAPPPLRFDWIDASQSSQDLRQLLTKTAPDAIVLWTDTPSARAVLPVLRADGINSPVYLCRKAAQFALGPSTSKNVFTFGSADSSQANNQSKFVELYRARTATLPTLAAKQVYEAVQLLGVALRATGNNRVLLRDYLANQTQKSDSSALVFDSAGNDLQQFAIVNLVSLNP